MKNQNIRIIFFMKLNDLKSVRRFIPTIERIVSNIFNTFLKSEETIVDIYNSKVSEKLFDITNFECLLYLRCQVKQKLVNFNSF